MNQAFILAVQKHFSECQFEHLTNNEQTSVQLSERSYCYYSKLKVDWLLGGSTNFPGGVYYKLEKALIHGQREQSSVELSEKGKITVHRKNPGINSVSIPL